MLRILHIADAHLDTPFYGREEALRRKLREATRTAFAAAVDVAIERGVDAVLIAGDLFDNDLLSFRTERFLLDAMARLDDASIPVFYATGNHDPGRTGSRAAQLDWPKNVHVFADAQPETIKIGDVGRLTAAGHATAAEERNLAATFPPACDDRPHVAMLHTQVDGTAGADRHDRYAPCTPADLARTGYDYWALGHVHIGHRIAEDLPAWYPGNLQGRNPREIGPKGVLYIEIERGVVPTVEFIPLAPIVWDAVTLAPPADADRLETLVRAVSHEARSHLDLADGREHFVRLDLRGASPLAAELRLGENVRELAEALQEELGVAWLELRTHDVLRPVPLEQYRDGASVLGTALELIERAQRDDALLAKLCPAALAGSREDKLAYLRELLDGAELDLAARLVPEEKR
jgi:DNA repair protein SbcD/Mre11